jgi:uncharacterized Rossmann fold enzyme
MQQLNFTPIDKVEVTTATSIEDIKANILDARKRNLSPIQDCPAWRSGEPIAIVGGGPSLRDNLDKLRKYKNIMACGSVHDYLVKAGILPNWCIICDPDPIMGSYLHYLNFETQYLVATQCNPSLFSQLRQVKTYTWNCHGDRFDASHFGEGVITIGGGCTIGTRAMIMALHMGFNYQHLFGFDTCIQSEEDHHAYPFNYPDKEKLGEIAEIQLNPSDPNDRKFKVVGYMLGQLFDFKKILAMHADVLKVTIIGDGLLAHLMKLAKEKSLTIKDEDVAKLHKETLDKLEKEYANGN